MPPLPSTLVGVVTLVALVLPGVIYAAVRMRFRGYGTADKELASQIVRAFAFSFVLDTIYLALLGDRLIGWMTFEQTGIPAHPRQMGIALLVLGILIPTLFATLQFGVRFESWTYKRLTIKYPRVWSLQDPAPTAWDKIADRQGNQWVRVRLSDDRWVGGWISTDSFVSKYPEPPDIFIESQHHMEEDGKFGEEVNGTAGVWVPLKDATLVEWIIAELPEQENPDEQKRQRRTWRYYWRRCTSRQGQSPRRTSRN